MSPPPLKKRSYGESLAVVEAEESSGVAASEGAAALLSRTTTLTFGVSSLPPFMLEQQIESLKIELDHERNLRSLDLKRAQHAKERLEKQVEIAVEEAKEATKALEDFRVQSERLTEQLRQSRNQAMAELRKREIERLENAHPSESEDLDDFDEEDNDDDNNQQRSGRARPHRRRHASSMSNVWKEKCQHLEKLLEAQRVKEKELHDRFASLRADVEARAKQQQQQHAKRESESKSTAVGTVLLEDAPPAVMKELNRIRISLAESERRERQLNRKLEEMQRRNQSLIRDREEARLAQDRLPVVQEQFEQIRKDYETLAAQHEAWNEFGACLATVLDKEPYTPMHLQPSPSTERTKSVQKQKGPPELSVIQRFLEDAKSRVLDLEKQNTSLQQQNKNLKTSTLPLETKIKELSEAEEAAKRESRDMERKLNACQHQITQLESQNIILRREITNLQSLINTFDNLPLQPTSASKGDHSQQILEISLASTKEELRVVRDEKNRLLKESEETHNELERVKEKFGKLRDALHAERAKVEQAEQRANEAETLAGKGSFNIETTRVLHIQETPLMQSLKEEIKVLQRQLEVANNASSSSSSTSSKQIAIHDPDKLNKRLKENFKEQIALFREGVYLMTGFKVDMLPGTDRPTFRVRSMYAEHEEDHLMLKWPKVEDVRALDLLNTDLAKTLTKSPSYDYVAKFHSLPAFLASAQLSWFEKQTVM